MLTHLLFADDSIIFGEATTRGAHNLQLALNTYANCSGQLINYDKSSVFFSSNVIEENRREVCRLLQVSVQDCPDRYLGLPSVVGRNKKASLTFIKDKCSSSMNSWSTRSLSMGGKEVYIKSVLQAIPLYSMSCFLLPKSLCSELQTLFVKFWWQNVKTKKGIYWCSWQALCQPKDQGGMGFRDLGKFNIAMLAKQGWRILTNPESLVTRVLKARYFPNFGFLNANLGSRPSYIWRSIWCLRKALEMGLYWKVGNGMDISIWDDYWLPTQSLRKINTPRITGLTHVSDLMLPTSQTWDTDLIMANFTSDDSEIILSIRLSTTTSSNALAWIGEHTGTYSVRSGNKILNQSQSVTTYTGQVFSNIWKIQCPTKIRINLWKFVLNYIPCMHNLSMRNISSHGMCPRCHNQPETTMHIVWQCSYIRQIWDSLHITWPLELENTTCWEWMEWHFANNTKENHMLIAVTIWAIWFSRNKLLHEGTQQSQSTFLTFIRNYITELQQLSIRLHHPHTHDLECWQAPQNPEVKVNIDASFSLQQQKSWSGIIIRDAEGLILRAAHRLTSNIPTPFEAEAQALVHGLEFADDLGFHEIVVEGDSKSVINKMKSTELDRSKLRPYIIDAKNLSRRFRRCQFTFIGRKDNQATHAMADLGKRSSEDRFWVEDAPAEAQAMADLDRRFTEPP
ncbi:hypothetical protein HRI_004102900 [Hibiscus trionum]|uniref:Reverse transcriptase n=1 Tax=Hibiscus trionum TaxID=183268 RepID=A0A9W7J0C2_HIBTR|nr:hypothetical protein HRI_004102900 [Hibiscus trionum]